MAFSNARKRGDVNHTDLAACCLDKGSSCPQSFAGGYPQVYEQVWKTPEKFVDNLRRVNLTDKTDILM